MSSVRLPLNIPLMEEESHAPTDLSGKDSILLQGTDGKKETGMGIT